MRTYYRKNREKYLADMRAYYLRNKEKVIKRTKEWAISHPEKVKAARKKRLLFEKSGEWKSNPKYIFSILKDNSKAKGRTFPLTRQEFLDWYSLQERMCTYCGVPEEVIKNNGFYRFEIDRPDTLEPYRMGNLCLACYFCNRVKREILTSDEASFVGKHIISKRWGLCE